MLLTIANIVVIIHIAIIIFLFFDFDNIIANYSEYLKGELKDYMLIYMSEEDYSNFYNFFEYCLSFIQILLLYI